jgi:sugar-specific transcriptional regulator TrmB
MEETLRILENTGLSKNEAKIYYTLIRTGETTATELAKESGLHRPNVYDALKSLIRKGLVSHITVNKTTKFKSEPPNNLITQIKQQEADILKIIPTLELEQKLARKEESAAEVHQGLKAFRTCFFNLLKYNKTLYAFGVPQIVPQIVSPFIDNFHRERIKKKILFRHIYNEDARERMKYLNSLPYTEAAYLPEKFNSPVSTITGGPEILLVRWQPVMFIRIVDEDLAKAYQNYCEKLLDYAQKS